MNPDERLKFIEKVTKQYHALKYVREEESKFEIDDDSDGIRDAIFRYAVKGLANFGFAVAQRRRKRARSIVGNPTIKDEISRSLNFNPATVISDAKIPLIVDAIFRSAPNAGFKIPIDDELLGACCDEVLL